MRALPSVLKTTPSVRAGLLVVASSFAMVACGDEPEPYYQMIVTVTNVSAEGALSLSDGTTASIGLSPGLWLLHNEGQSLIAPDSSASEGVERMAERGDAGTLYSELNTIFDFGELGRFGLTDEATYEDGPLGPGQSLDFRFDPQDGNHLSLVMMFGESNDVVVASISGGVSLFDDAGEWIEGDITATLTLYDVGTEANEEPGLGPNQAPRQIEPDAGASGEGTVQELTGPDSAGFTYPSVDSFLTVTVSRVLGPLPD